VSISLQDLLLQLGVDEPADGAMHSTLKKTNQLITETKRISEYDVYYDVDYAIIIIPQMIISQIFESSLYLISKPLSPKCDKR
jgi:hypothetical protein